MKTRREFLRTSATAALVAASPTLASALTVASTAVALPKGRSLIGMAQGDPGIFKNLALGGANLQSAAGYNFPRILNADGYPQGTPTQTIFTTFHLPSTITTSTQMVFRWTGSATHATFGAIGIGLSSPGVKVISGSNFVVGSTTYALNVAGTNGRVVFTFNYIPSSVPITFAGGATFYNLSGIILCKLSDEAAILAAKTAADFFDDSYVATYQALNPGVLRPMGWTDPNDSNNVTQHRYRTPWQTGATMWSARWVPNCWAGGPGATGAISGTNAYIAAAAADTPAKYTHGEVIQGQFLNTNTVANPTLDVGGRGPKTIRPINGSIMATSGTGSQRILAGGLATLSYDSLLDCWLFTQGGMTTNMPIEFQVAFANRINAHFWYNYPGHITDDSVTQITSYIRDNLSPQLNAYFEFSNEIWNNTFQQTSFAGACGTALGFPADYNRQVHGYYALKVRQIMELTTTAWAPRARSKLKRVMAIQAVGTSPSVNTYRFQGSDLKTGAGNKLYDASIGKNYSQAPNRPIDFCDVVSYAPYYSGGQTLQFDALYVSAKSLGLNISGLMKAADDYASGDRIRMANAIAWLDNDINSGTKSDGSPGDLTLLYYAKNVYPAWEAIAASYDSYRAASGLTPLTVECYEGGFGAAAPSAATCATLGISASYATSISNLISAYRLSGQFYKTVLAQYSQFMAKPHSRTPAWLIVVGPNPWSLSSGDTFAPKFQSWNANMDYNHGAN